MDILLQLMSTLSLVSRSSPISLYFPKTEREKAWYLQMQETSSDLNNHNTLLPLVDTIDQQLAKFSIILFSARFISTKPTVYTIATKLPNEHIGSLRAGAVYDTVFVAFCLLSGGHQNVEVSVELPDVCTHSQMDRCNISRTKSTVADLGGG